MNLVNLLNIYASSESNQTFSMIGKIVLIVAIAIVVLTILIIYLCCHFVIIKQGYKAITETFGTYKRTLGPGLHFLRPFEQIATKHVFMPKNQAVELNNLVKHSERLGKGTCKLYIPYYKYVEYIEQIKLDEKKKEEAEDKALELKQNNPTSALVNLDSLSFAKVTDVINSIFGSNDFKTYPFIKKLSRDDIIKAVIAYSNYKKLNLNELNSNVVVSAVKWYADWQDIGKWNEYNRDINHLDDSYGADFITNYDTDDSTNYKVIELALCANLREICSDIKKTEGIITKDNAIVNVDPTVFFVITDPFKYFYGSKSPEEYVEYLSAATLRNLIGSLTLEETMVSRVKMNEALREALDKASDAWGIKVTRVEIQKIVISKDNAVVVDDKGNSYSLYQAMNKVLIADRLKRATILEAEGEMQKKILSAQGVKESQILVAEGLKEKLILEAEGTKQSIILNAAGTKESTILQSEGNATSIVNIKNADAEGIRLTRSAEAEGYEKLKAASVDENVLKIRGYEALKDMANGTSTKIYFPNDLNNLVNSVANKLAAPLSSQPVPTPVVVAPVVEEKEEKAVSVAEPVEEKPAPETVVAEVKVEEKPVEEVKPQEEVVAPAPEEEKPVEEPKKEYEEISFRDRLIAGDDSLKENYNLLKNVIMSYGVNSRVTKAGDTFRLHCNKYARIIVAGKNLKVFLALDPKDYKDSTIPFQDVSFKKFYQEIPFAFKVKSKLSVKRAIELIEETFKKAGIEQAKVGNTDWYQVLLENNDIEESDED